MRRLTKSGAVLLFVLIFSGTGHARDNSSVSEARYFGEKPPGLKPELFDPKIVSPNGRFEGGSFSPDMKEFYFTRRYGKYKDRTFFVIRYENNGWGQVIETDIRWPRFSADGKMAYGGKFYREKTETGWSAPKYQGDFLKEQGHGIWLSSKGTYFFPFFKEEDKGHGNLGYSRLIDGKYESPMALGPEINKGDFIAHPYIAPDESYLMWDVEREDGYGNSDIYISFKDKWGSWSPAENMGSLINTEYHDSSPQVTPDGKYLFFKRTAPQVMEDGSKIQVGKSYWVDAKIIEDLRPDK